MTATDPRADYAKHDAHRVFVGAGPNSPVDHPGGDTQWVAVDAETSPRTDQDAAETHNHGAGAGPNQRGSRTPTDPHVVSAAVPQHRDDQSSSDTQCPGVVAAQLVSDPSVGDTRSAKAKANAKTTPPSGTEFGDTQKATADGHLHSGVVDGQDRVHAMPAAHPSRGPVLADPLLALAADVLDDLERVRIANENRFRQLTRDETDADGEERGFGLTTDHPDVKRLDALVSALAKAEHDAELNLRRLLRQHPLGPWVKSTRGVGEKQAARLLASIGDPYWNDLHNRPRTVSELWAYAGYHVLTVSHSRPDDQRLNAGGAQPSGGSDQSALDAERGSVGAAATRTRGVKSNWSSAAKMRAYLVSVSIVKAGGPYREVYDEGRAKYADTVHQVPCKRCGPKDKPALAGSPLSAGHQHARALRLVSKAVLRDLWREAARLHGHLDSQSGTDPQGSSAVGASTSGDHCKGDDQARSVVGTTAGGAS